MLVPPPPPSSEAAETARICREVEGMSSLATLSVLERQHKGQAAGECVAARIEELKKRQAPVVAPPVLRPTFDGQWSGVLTQIPAGSAGSTYRVDMTLDGDKGTIVYMPNRTLGCNGSLALISDDGSRRVFREQIIYGKKRCLNGGHVTLQLRDERLAYSWSGAHLGLPYSVTGLLSRKVVGK
jgi:hypothetical protein